MSSSALGSRVSYLSQLREVSDWLSVHVPFTDPLPCGDPQSQEPFRKSQEEQEEESLSSSSSDLTVSISEDDLILKSPEPQPNLGDMMEQEGGTETLNVIHSEQERDAPSTRKPNCILQAPSTPDSPNESFTNLPARE